MNKKNYALRFFTISLLLIFCDCAVAQNQLTAKKPSGKEAIEMTKGKRNNTIEISNTEAHVIVKSPAVISLLPHAFLGESI